MALEPSTEFSFVVHPQVSTSYIKLTSDFWILSLVYSITFGNSPTNMHVYTRHLIFSTPPLELPIRKDSSAVTGSVRSSNVGNSQAHEWRKVLELRDVGDYSRYRQEWDIVALKRLNREIRRRV